MVLVYHICMDTKSMKEIFDSISKPYDVFVKFISFGQNAKWHKSIATNLNEGNLLDIGTATGDVIIRSFEANKIDKAFGIDLSTNMLKIAKYKLKGKNAYFIVGSAEDIPFKDKTFNNISMSLVFRHIIDKDKMLKEVYRTLKPKGRFLIIDTTKFFLIDMFAMLSKTILRPIGLIIFGEKNWEFFIHSLENSLSTKEIINMCQTHGLRLLNRKKFVFGMVNLLVFEKP